MSSSPYTPPDPDEIEVSMFGPGVGESIAIHVGASQWMVIDSCVEGRSGTNPALSYLEQLGVNINTDVVLVVATHAHDDHVEGMREIVDRAEAAKFVVPMAATLDEFFALLSLDEENDLLDVRPSAYAEYRAINDILTQRASGMGKYPAYTFAVAGLPVWQRPAAGDAPAVLVTALAPSQESVVRSKQWLGAQLVPGAARKRVTPDDPNTFAVALQVAVGDINMLFGADLMRGPGPRCGWNAVVAAGPAGGTKSSLYKVAHHGSARSEHPGIWTTLLAEDPVSVLTPYRPSGIPLPADVARICGLSAGAYSTAITKEPAKPPKVRRAAAELAAIALSVRERKGLTGHVRARRRAGQPVWNIDTWAPALSICA